MHIARVGERLPRLQIQFRISRSFRPRNLANLGSKIRFWIRQKKHTLRLQWLVVAAYEVLVVSLYVRVPCTWICCHSTQREVLVLEFVPVSWHQKKDKNAGQFGSM